jgi:hypothetical protein
MALLTVRNSKVSATDICYIPEAIRDILAMPSCDGNFFEKDDHVKKVIVIYSNETVETWEIVDGS